MQFEKMALKDAYLITSFFAGDSRGGFEKIFERDIYYKEGIDFSVNETFVSYSNKNVIRGLHFQLSNPQAKIVTVLSGRVWDVIVDIRKDSPTFGKWVGEILSHDNHKAFYVPKGFAHGFAALEDNSIMLYQCQEPYDRDTDTGILYDDPTLGIKWPINIESSIHSERDLQLMSFLEYLSIT